MQQHDLRTAAPYVRRGHHRPLSTDVVLCGRADVVSLSHLEEHLQEEHGLVTGPSQCILPAGHGGAHEFQTVTTDGFKEGHYLRFNRVGRGASVLRDIYKGIASTTTSSGDTAHG